MIALALLGVGLRIGYVLLTAQTPIINDGWYHHRGANLLADGDGYISPSHPFYGDLTGKPAVPDAIHPPAWRLTLTLPSLLGLRSVVAHQLYSALIGVGTIVVVALAARKVAGPRVGVIAAALTAVLPSFWIYERELLIETLLLLVGAVTVLVVYRYLERPSTLRLVLVGALCGLLTMTRAEQALLLPLLGLPLALGDRALPLLHRFGRFALCTAAFIAVVTPWFGYNLTRFDRPVPVSLGLGYTMMVSNCGPTYHGDRLGFFDARCGFREKALRLPDRSDADAEMREIGVRYARRHAGRLPVVVAVRELRTFGLYRPVQQVRFHQVEKGTQAGESLAEAKRLTHEPNTGVGRFAPYLWIVSGWVTMAAAILGGIVLHRRGVRVYPLVVIVVPVVVATALAFGQPRYRAAAEVAFVVLTAVAADEVVGRLRRNRSHAADGAGHQTIGT